MLRNKTTICTRIYQKVLLCIVGKIPCRKFTIPTRYSQAQNGKTIDFNTESQNKFVSMPHMALTKEPILHIRDTRQTIPSNPISIVRCKITTCTSHIGDGKKQDEVTSLETQNTSCSLDDHKTVLRPLPTRNYKNQQSRMTIEN